MPQTEQPLRDHDLRRIRTRAERTRLAVRRSIALAIATHLATAAFLLSTPTDFSQPGKAALGLFVVTLLGAPLWLFAVDARRTRAGLLAAEDLRKTTRLYGPLARTVGRQGAIVEHVTFGLWPAARTTLLPGGMVDVEYLGQPATHVPLRSVLRINGHDNPYFDTVVRAGPPGP
ncbi:MAG: hypothetical protein ACRBN8_38790 [Nannocystales bacterium]